MALMRIGPITVLPLFICACASVAPPPAPSPLPTLRSIVVNGPALGLDWPTTLHRFEGTPTHQHALAEIEATVAEAYVWAEWREVQVVAMPVPDDDGTLRVSVFAEPPDASAPPPAALQWPPPEVVPAPSAAAGAREETVLDAALSAWQQSDSRVLIDGGERRLYLKRRDGRVVSYPVAVGTMRTPTPAGDYTVEAVRQKPTWYPPASIRRSYAAQGKALPAMVPPGPGNPLGEWFVRLQNGIGIHGTNQPRSIGRAASYGCVRMHDRDVEQVVAQLQRGDGVTVIHSRTALIARQ